MLAMPLSSSLTQLTRSFLSNCQLLDFQLQQGLDKHHWLMDNNPRPALLGTLKQYPPGTLLTNKDGQHWIRRAKMAIARCRFISSVGDDQEKFYQQKFNIS